MTDKQKIKYYESLLIRAVDFILDAKGNWDTYQGNKLHKEIAQLDFMNRPIK